VRLLGSSLNVHTKPERPGLPTDTSAFKSFFLCLTVHIIFQ